MNRADKLIVLGVITIPVAGGLFFGILAILTYGNPYYGLAPFYSLGCLVVALAAGLTTIGILLRKAPPK